MPPTHLRPQRFENETSTLEVKTLALGMVFFMQTGAGLLGNFLLLYHFTFALLTGKRLRPTDSIYFHLALTNSLVLISKGVPQTTVGLGLKIFPERIMCKLILAIHRVTRNVSINITCLLSGFQMITIAPFKFSLWPELKTHITKCIFPLCLFCWIPNLFINIFIFVNMENFRESDNNTRIWNLGFCSAFAPASFNILQFLIMYCIADFLCMGLIIVASGYLVLLLRRHHQQVQHIHNSSLLSRKSPEIRATYTVLVLVSTYVSFYSINSILSFYLFQFHNYDQWLIPISSLLVACFPAFSPFVIIISDSQILHFFCDLWGKKRSQDSPFPW